MASHDLRFQGPQSPAEQDEPWKKEWRHDSTVRRASVAEALQSPLPQGALDQEREAWWGSEGVQESDFAWVRWDLDNEVDAEDRDSASDPSRDVDAFSHPTSIGIATTAFSAQAPDTTATAPVTDSRARRASIFGDGRTGPEVWGEPPTRQRSGSVDTAAATSMLIKAENQLYRSHAKAESEFRQRPVVKGSGPQINRINRFVGVDDHGDGNFDVGHQFREERVRPSERYLRDHPPAQGESSPPLINPSQLGRFVCQGASSLPDLALDDPVSAIASGGRSPRRVLKKRSRQPDVTQESRPRIAESNAPHLRHNRQLVENLPPMPGTPRPGMLERFVNAGRRAVEAVHSPRSGPPTYDQWVAERIKRGESTPGTPQEHARMYARPNEVVPAALAARDATYSDELDHNLTSEGRQARVRQSLQSLFRDMDDEWDSTSSEEAIQGATLGNEEIS